MKLGFLVDLNLCMGCKGCEIACKVENNVPIGSWRLRVKYIDIGTFPDTSRNFTPLRCNHCESAPCERICPVSALHYLENGIVNVDSSRCIGCAGCMMACPYGAIYMDPETNTADKCTYCAHRVESGMMPACVVICPVQANIFGDVEDDTSNISQYIMAHQMSGVQVRKPEKNTHPKHYYVGGGTQTLDPLAQERLEGYSLFNNVTHLKHIGDPHESVLDRFLEPFKGEEKYDNKSFMNTEKTNDKGGH